MNCTIRFRIFGSGFCFGWAGSRCLLCGGGNGCLIGDGGDGCLLGGWYGGELGLFSPSVVGEEGLVAGSEDDFDDDPISEDNRFIEASISFILVSFAWLFLIMNSSCLTALCSSINLFKMSLSSTLIDPFNLFKHIRWNLLVSMVLCNVVNNEISCCCFKITVVAYLNGLFVIRYNMIYQIGHITCNEAALITIYV